MHKIIYQHMGLGDHLICNGLIRWLASMDPMATYTLFVKPHNIDSVKYMFRDLKNLSLIPTYDEGARHFISQTRFNNEVVLVLVGHTEWAFPDMSFEQNFYLQNRTPLYHKWLSFRCNRDPEQEDAIVKHYNIKEDYIFVHDDSRFFINASRLPTGMRIVRPEIGLTANIFAYAKLIENAKEVHCIESSFAFMVDLMKLNPNFYIHRYARNISKIEVPEYKTVKEILT